MGADGGYEARFFHSSSAGASMPRSWVDPTVLPSTQKGRRPRVAASPDQPLRHSAVHRLSMLQVPTLSSSAGGINAEGSIIPIILQFYIVDVGYSG